MSLSDLQRFGITGSELRSHFPEKFQEQIRRYEAQGWTVVNHAWTARLCERTYHLEVTLQHRNFSCEQVLTYEHQIDDKEETVKDYPEDEQFIIDNREDSKPYRLHETTKAKLESFKENFENAEDDLVLDTHTWNPWNEGSTDRLLTKLKELTKQKSDSLAQSQKVVAREVEVLNGLVKDLDKFIREQVRRDDESYDKDRVTVFSELREVKRLLTHEPESDWTQDIVATLKAAKVPETIRVYQAHAIKLSGTEAETKFDIEQGTVLNGGLEYLARRKDAQHLLVPLASLAPFFIRSAMLEKHYHQRTKDDDKPRFRDRVKRAAIGAAGLAAAGGAALVGMAF